MSRGGISSNASWHYVVFSSTDVVRSSAKPVKFWDGCHERSPFAQNEMNKSLSPNLVSVLALGDVDPLGRSGLSANAAIKRNAHESGTCLCAGHATDALGGHELLSPFWML